MITKKQKVRIVILVIILVVAIVAGAFAISSQLGGVELPWTVFTSDMQAADNGAAKDTEQVDQTKASKDAEATEANKATDTADAEAKDVASEKATEPEADAAADDAAVDEKKTADATDSADSTESDNTKTDTANASAAATGVSYPYGGALSVSEDGKLLDKDGNEIRLVGLSSHGLSWYSEYITPESIAYLRDTWGINCLRLAVYPSDYNGYCVGGADVQSAIMDTVKTAIEAALAHEMYVIIDWHVLNEQTPLEYKSEAIQFFGQLVRDYKDCDNVIYEICNEPNGDTTWADVKKYAKEVIPVIREVDKDALILVGSPDYSTDLADVLEDPLDYDNIMYTYHFYASSHGTRQRTALMDALDEGLPVFISEFGFTKADGDGSIDEKEAARWLEIIDEYGLSTCLWNLSNKDEASSIISADCDKLTDWTYDDLSAQGQYVYDLIKETTKDDN